MSLLAPSNCVLMFQPHPLCAHTLLVTIHLVLTGGLTIAAVCQHARRLLPSFAHVCLGMPPWPLPQPCRPHVILSG